MVYKVDRKRLSEDGGAHTNVKQKPRERLAGSTLARHQYFTADVELT